MSRSYTGTEDSTLVQTANDRFKRADSMKLYVGLLVAVLLHLAFFVVFPRMEGAPAAEAAEPTDALSSAPVAEVLPLAL